MNYPIVERFKSPQGEGIFTGTPMAFIRFVGCSVGKTVCHACDTAFERILPWNDGGSFSPQQLVDWALPYQHICLTGGEPLDHDLWPLVEEFRARTEGEGTIHIETSGTRLLPAVFHDAPDLHICVSPKPGFLEANVLHAHEIKVIVPGLGSGEGWPTLEHALMWAEAGKMVFLQPRNGRHELDRTNLARCLELIHEHPILRLSIQAHKVLGVQ